MRVVQTFWSGNKNPLKDSFGWLSPQYNLMSWAFSCLCLRENYEEVILYTDSAGYKIFHEYLQLPYTNIIVQYDNLQCKEHHWAYPKLLTYSIQDKPFIHVDGDVYMPKRLAVEIESGKLITQNAEIGTSYYKFMMDEIMRNSKVIPDFLLKELEKDSISSYNAGVFGGNDLDFIKKYCHTAFNFISDNHLNDIDNNNINVNYNILFEQILFYAHSSKDNKEVSTVLNHSLNDNGYTYEEFCDFYSLENRDLMHIIGGHKKNTKCCELLGRTLLKRYPEYFNKIIGLFPDTHKRINLQLDKVDIVETDLHQKKLFPYYDVLKKLSIQWKELPNEYLLNSEKQSCNYFDFLNSSKEDRLLMIIKRNPHLSIYEISKNWDSDTNRILKDRISRDFHSDNFDIAYIPILLNDGYKEVLINDLHYNILILLHEQKTFGNLLEEIKKSFSDYHTNGENHIYDLVFNALEYLCYNKLMYID